MFTRYTLQYFHVVLLVFINAWMIVEGVIDDRRISQILKVNVLSSFVTPAYMNALDAVALTGKQQENVQVRENILVRKIGGLLALIREEWKH